VVASLSALTVLKLGGGTAEWRWDKRKTLHLHSVYVVEKDKMSASFKMGVAELSIAGAGASAAEPATRVQCDDRLCVTLGYRDKGMLPIHLTLPFPLCFPFLFLFPILHIRVQGDEAVESRV
jgi:hypothetical protein